MLTEGVGYPELSCYHVEVYTSSELGELGSGAIAVLVSLENDPDCNR